MPLSKPMYHFTEKYINPPEQVQSYESSLKYYRDLQNTMDTAWGDGHTAGREEGRAEGREEGIDIGKQQVALNLLEMGMSDEQVMTAAELTPKQLAQLKTQRS